MDLARCGRVDFAERFLASYARAANDYELYRVVDFYESYRACIRAKISAMMGRAEARRELLLAQSARRRAILDPEVIAVAGGIASGYEPISELPPTEHFRIDTHGSIDDALAQAKREIETWPRGLVQ
jgi:hypothetical protein